MHIILDHVRKKEKMKIELG